MKGSLSKERITKLQSIGFDLVIYSDDELWNKKYDLIREFYCKYSRFPLKSDIESGKVDIPYSWIITQRKYRKKNKLSKEQIQKLDEVGFIWNPEETRWNSKFEALKKFVDKNGRIPKTMENYCGFNIGQWYGKQIEYLNMGKLKDDRVKKLQSLDVMNVLVSERKWLVKFESLKRFIAINHRLPYSEEIFENFNLYNWINKQKDKLKTGMLDYEHLKKLESLDFNLLNFSSNKLEEVPSQRWINMYGEYKEFILQNGRRPKRGIKNEGKLYRWRRRQISALESGKLNDKQKNMLTAIGFK